MSERDKRYYATVKADPERYARYIEERKRMRLNRQANRGTETERKRRWRAANREADRRMRRAHSAVEYAIETGRLVRPDQCSKCGSGANIDAHHHKGYAPECYLDVVWLCDLCHQREHAIMRSPAIETQRPDREHKE